MYEEYLEEEQLVEQQQGASANAYAAPHKHDPEQQARSQAAVPSYAAALAPQRSSIGSGALAPATPQYAPTPVYEGVRLARQRAEESGNGLRYGSAGSAVGELSGRFRFPGRALSCSIPVLSFVCGCMGTCSACSWVLHLCSSPRAFACTATSHDVHIGSLLCLVVWQCLSLPLFVIVLVMHSSGNLARAV